MNLILIMIFFSHILLIGLFMLMKSNSWDNQSSSSFECGFSVYFMSRFSFSIHYYEIAMIFLFLDLELCYIMPFFNQDYNSINASLICWVFMLILVLGLIEEWKENQIDFKF